MTTAGSAIPGWYPDPLNPAQLRYWDGASWSDATSPAGAPASGYGQMPYGAAVQRPGAGGPLGDLGDWFTETFKVAVDRIVVLAILLFVIPAVGLALLTAVAVPIVADIQFNTLTDEFSGFDPLRLIPLAVGYVVVTVLTLVCWLAASHQLYHAHLGNPRSLGSSLTAGLVRLPRTVGWGLILALVWGLAFAVLIMGPIVLTAEVSSWFGVLIALLVTVFVVGSFVAGVYLVHFTTAAAVAPWGTGPIGTSVALVRGRFLATLGRVLLLGAALLFISSIGSFVINTMGQILLFSSFEVDPVTNDVIIDGRNVSEQVVISGGDFLPALPGLVLLTILSTANQAVSQILWLSGLTGLYRRAGGPSDMAATGAEPAAGSSVPVG